MRLVMQPGMVCEYSLWSVGLVGLAALGAVFLDLAFVAMLAWEHFNKAKAASYVETALVLDVYNVSVGFADPEMSAMQRVVLPRRARAGNQVEALGELGEQPRDVGRIVLAVTVHRDDDVAGAIADRPQQARPVPRPSRPSSRHRQK